MYIIMSTKQLGGNAPRGSFTYTIITSYIQVVIYIQNDTMDTISLMSYQGVYPWFFSISF